jgi:hypothetical protein
MRIALLSTSDTDLLSARASGADYVYANPARSRHQSMSQTIEGCHLVVGRILGSPQDLCSGFARIKATGMPVVVLGGEQTPSAELMELSSVPIGIAADAHRYLAEGGPDNLAQLHAFRSLTGFPDLGRGRWRGEATKQPLRRPSPVPEPVAGTTGAGRPRCRPGTPLLGEPPATVPCQEGGPRGVRARRGSRRRG